MSTVDDLLRLRYYHPGETTWEELCSRVSSFLYPNNDSLRKELLRAMTNKSFIPSTPVLANAASPQPMLCSCFVLPVGDSITEIMKALTDTVMIQKYGGGVGLDFSPIRAEGSVVSTTRGRASGPVSFMGLWNTAMEVIKQGGKRQGALMGVMSVHHPDLLRFMSAKEVEGKLTNFNISVALDAEFFNDLKYSNGNNYACGMNAEGILNLLAEHAWSNGEPGVLFMDNINNRSKYKETIYSTNPCGEVPLPPYGACCLGSINLNHAISQSPSGAWYLDNDKLNKLVCVGVYTLNEVLNKTWWPLPEIKEFEDSHRPIGLGVMGLADMLAKLMIPYGKDGGFINKLMYTIRDMAEKWARVYAESARLPINTTVLSIAPTGSIAMLANASYGIEPYFSLAYTKRVAAGEFVCTVDVVEKVVKQQGIEFTDDDWITIQNTGSMKDTKFPEDLKLVFRTASEIPYSEHLQVQSDVQAWVDNSVSKTINLPSRTSQAEIKEIIKSAHLMGIKGLTMYRARSRQVEVMECPTGTCDIN